MLLIGSVAMASRGVKRPYHAQGGEVDVICTFDEYARIAAAGQPIPGTRAFRFGSTIVDPEIATPGSSAADYLALDKSGPTVGLFYDGLDVTLDRMDVATIPILYSLKRSHRHSPKAWRKHIADYHLLKAKLLKTQLRTPRRDGCFDEHAAITAKREAETGKRKHISLKRTVTEFFDDDVSNQVFVHDDIHEAVAHRKRPMFHYIRVAEDRVTCDRRKWDALLVEDKARCVLEEAYVIALERGIIPFLFQQKKPATAESAFGWAMMRICTTLTSGWFRDFATENLPLIRAMSDMCYPATFFAAVDAGKVQRISSHSVRA